MKASEEKREKLFKVLIEICLTSFDTIVQEKESESYVELIMDDHICIRWEDVEYYISKDNSFYTDNDDLILDFLSDHYIV